MCVVGVWCLSCNNSVIATYALSVSGAFKDSEGPDGLEALNGLKLLDGLGVIDVLEALDILDVLDGLKGLTVMQSRTL